MGVLIAIDRNRRRVFARGAPDEIFARVKRLHDLGLIPREALPMPQRDWDEHTIGLLASPNWTVDWAP